MEQACIHNNSLDRLIGNYYMYYMLTEEELEEFLKFDDENASSKAEASNQISRQWVHSIRHAKKRQTAA
jgi:hypothetical protein